MCVGILLIKLKSRRSSGSDVHVLVLSAQRTCKNTKKNLVLMSSKLNCFGLRLTSCPGQSSLDNFV